MFGLTSISGDVSQNDMWACPDKTNVINLCQKNNRILSFLAVNRLGRSILGLAGL